MKTALLAEARRLIAEGEYGKYIPLPEGWVLSGFTNEAPAWAVLEALQ